MKKAEYRVVAGERGFKDLESKVSEMLTAGWKTIGGVAFNAGYPYQAMARLVDSKEAITPEKQESEQQKPRALGASEAMKRVDELT